MFNYSWFAEGSGNSEPSPEALCIKSPHQVPQRKVAKAQVFRIWDPLPCGWDLLVNTVHGHAELS